MVFWHHLKEKTLIISMTALLILWCVLITGCSTTHNPEQDRLTTSTTTLNAEPMLAGMSYLTGIKQAANPLQAVSWLERAASQGDSAAASTLGYLYATGTAVTQDYGIALQWYTTAANAGNAAANYNIGLMYAYGLGTAIDNPKAQYYLQQAATLGFP